MAENDLLPFWLGLTVVLAEWKQCFADMHQHTLNVQNAYVIDLMHRMCQFGTSLVISIDVAVGSILFLF